MKCLLDTQLKLYLEVVKQVQVSGVIFILNYKGRYIHVQENVRTLVKKLPILTRARDIIFDYFVTSKSIIETTFGIKYFNT